MLSQQRRCSLFSSWGFVLRRHFTCNTSQNIHHWYFLLAWTFQHFAQTIFCCSEAPALPPCSEDPRDWVPEIRYINNNSSLSYQLSDNKNTHQKEVLETVDYWVDCKDWLPVFSEDVEAHIAVKVNVGVIHLCLAFHLNMGIEHRHTNIFDVKVTWPLVAHEDRRPQS